MYLDINQREPQKNELISRAQMQANPPHILLTNYAMLEYLLLRPADTALFDGETGKHWRFIVLDEAHAYDGAQATEIAMLLRRLQDRVTQGGQKQLQAIVASATLGEDTPESRHQVAAFASKLFALNFEPDDVIFGKRQPESGLAPTWGSGTPALYAALNALAEQWRAGQKTMIPSVLPDITPQVLTQARAATQTTPEPLPRGLYELLKGDANIHLLRGILQRAPLTLKNAAQQVFPQFDEELAQTALSDLVSVAILARERSDKIPLLPARYHLFARALEGAFVCLNHSHPAHRDENKPLLFLTRQKFCEHCGSRVFELANCTRCGESYLIGDERDGSRLTETEFSAHVPHNPDLVYLIQNSIIYDSELEARRLHYFVLESLEVAAIDEDALIEEDAAAGTMPDETTEAMKICVHCGALYSSNTTRDNCSCGGQFAEISRVEMGKKRTLERCVSCSTYTRGGVIYRFLTGQDAPVSVLAGTLYRDVPQAKEDAPEHDNPGGGRKLLIFTDSRQRAAFFAPYLERAQERQLRRRLMVESLKKLHGEEPLRFSDWMDILLSYAKKSNVFPLDESLRNKRLTIATWLMLEFSGLDKRLGLEGVGLLYFRPFRLANWTPPVELLDSPWDFSPEEAYQVIAILLNTLRRQGAVTYLLENEDIHLLDSDKKPDFRPRARFFYIRQSEAESRGAFGIYSWLPSENYKNSRLDYLIRLLARKKGEKIPSAQTLQQAMQLLAGLWNYLTATKTGNWLQSEQAAKNKGIVYRLRNDLWEVIPTLSDLTQWHICNRCQNLSAFNAQNTCPTYGCSGTLEPLAQYPHVLDDNLYRYQYQHEAPLVLTAKEHTAQWIATKAAEIQKDFITGKVNALSCSTTFEMGVDVGDLNAVLLRNVPPSTANYMQRAGRAGRRTDSVAMVVTFAQRRQHDLTFYAQPERMIAGKIRPPVVPLQNDKIIRRHLHSVVFAAFLRWAKETQGIEYRYTGDFFAPENPYQNGVDLLRSYLADHPPEIQMALERVTPADDATLLERLRLKDWNWLPYLIDSEEAILDKTFANISGELNEFRKLEEKESLARNYKLAEDAKRVQETIRRRDLLGYLGSKNVLPKYGFPTDVVPLQTDHLKISGANEIELDRDLKQAISEFAPGGQVVAAGKIWQSMGLKRLPGRSWVFYGYAVCPACHRVNIQAGTTVPEICCCGLPLHKAREKGIYIVPEHGFIADSKTEMPGEQPPERTYASQIYLADYRASSDNPIFDARDIKPDPDFNAGTRVFKGYTRNAYLGLVNNGYAKGFSVCPVCGYANVILPGQRKPMPKHRNPLTHIDCNASLTPYHLGHHFLTDVLQLRFSTRIHGESLIYSLLYAILNGAHDALEIPRNDVDGIIFYQDNEPSFLLYDTTPGGSGHVEMIFNHLRQTLDGAYHRVFQCDGCASDTSCYSCLRGYTNQKWHDLLVRGIAARFLGQVLGYPTLEVKE